MLNTDQMTPQTLDANIALYGTDVTRLNTEERARLTALRAERNRRDGVILSITQPDEIADILVSIGYDLATLLNTIEPAENEHPQQFELRVLSGAWQTLSILASLGHDRDRRSLAQEIISRALLVIRTEPRSVWTSDLAGIVRMTADYL